MNLSGAGVPQRRMLLAALERLRRFGVITAEEHDGLVSRVPPTLPKEPRPSRRKSEATELAKQPKKDPKFGKQLHERVRALRANSKLARMLAMTAEELDTLEQNVNGRRAG